MLPPSHVSWTNAAARSTHTARVACLAKIGLHDTRARCCRRPHSGVWMSRLRLRGSRCTSDYGCARGAALHRIRHFTTSTRCGLGRDISLCEPQPLPYCRACARPAEDYTTRACFVDSRQYERDKGSNRNRSSYRRRPSCCARVRPIRYCSHSALCSGGHPPPLQELDRAQAACSAVARQTQEMMIDIIPCSRWHLKHLFAHDLGLAHAGWERFKVKFVDCVLRAAVALWSARLLMKAMCSCLD